MSDAITRLVAGVLLAAGRVMALPMAIVGRAVWEALSE